MAYAKPLVPHVRFPSPRDPFALSRAAEPPTGALLRFEAKSKDLQKVFSFFRLTIQTVYALSRLEAERSPANHVGHRETTNL